ncbi:MAG: SlyX family protein [Planctomycetales bacterium]
MPDNSGPDNSGSRPSDASERVANLEMLMTHLQRDVEALSQTVIEQQKRLDLLERLVQKLDLRIDQALHEPEVRDPLEERPPHY